MIPRSSFWKVYDRNF